MSILKRQVKSSSEFSSFFSVITNNSSLNFQLMHFILLTKGSHESTNFDTFKCSGKNLPKSSCHFQTTNQFFFKFCIIPQCNEKKLLCTFLGQKLYTLQKRDQSKCTFLGFLSARIRFHQILVILKPQLGFSSSFTSLFRLITHNSSVLFQLKFFISSTREVYLKYKFGEMKSLIFGILMGSFYQNNIKFLVQQYRRVISHDTVK